MKTLGQVMERIESLENTVGAMKQTIKDLLVMVNSQQSESEKHAAVLRAAGFTIIPSDVIGCPTTDSQGKGDSPDCDFGKIAKIVGNNSNHYFPIGTIVKLVDPSSEGFISYEICGKGFDSYGEIDLWGLCREDYELIPEKPEPTEPERWKPEVGEMFWLADDEEIRALFMEWENSQSDILWHKKDMIRKTESEALERSREINAQREAAETKQPDSGKDGNIISAREKSCPVSCSPSDWKKGGKCDTNGCYHKSEILPAGPLREMPRQGERVFMFWFGKKTRIITAKWDGSTYHVASFQAGLCFPDSPEGKAGAQLRAKQGIIPPIDREGLHRMYRRIIVSDDEMETPVVDLLIYLQSILEGGNQNE